MITEENRGGKRILFLINSLTIGGAEKMFILQSNELAMQGWTVSLATLFSDGSLKELSSLSSSQIHALNFRHTYDYQGLLRLRALLKKEQIDILYTTLNEANAIAKLVALSIPSIRLYTREANLADEKPWHYKLIDVLIGWRSERIIVVSRAVGRSVTAYVPWLSKKITILYNGITVLSMPKIYSRSGNTIKLLSVGSLTKKKDHTILIRALALLPEKYTLSIAGDGVLRSVLESLAKGAGVSSRVFFLGLVAPERMEQLYRDNDVFVLPSYREGCPNVVSEAQSCGLPVIAFNIPGMQEFVPSECGILVGERNPGGLAMAIRRIGDDLTQIETMGQAGYKEVSRTRDWKIQTSILIGFFCER